MLPTHRFLEIREHRRTMLLHLALDGRVHDHLHFRVDRRVNFIFNEIINFLENEVHALLDAQGYFVVDALVDVLEVLLHSYFFLPLQPVIRLPDLIAHVFQYFLINKMIL